MDSGFLVWPSQGVKERQSKGTGKAREMNRIDEIASGASEIARKNRVGAKSEATDLGRTLFCSHRTPKVTPNMFLFDWKKKI